MQVVNTEEVSVLVISDDSYYVMGIKNLLNDHFRNDISVRYQVMMEKTFTSALHEPGGLSIVLESSITFAGEQPYQKLIKYIKNNNICLFGTRHKPDEVIKSLAKVDLHARHEITIPGIHELLSKREGMIYFYMKRGVSDDYICSKMNITKKTVSSHRGHILKKLGYRNKVMMFKNEFKII